MITDPMLTELWIVALACLVNRTDAWPIHADVVTDLECWRGEGRPLAWDGWHMLSRADLDAIRTIVREEAERAFGHRGQEPTAVPEDQDEDIDPTSSLSPEHQRALGAFAGAMAHMRSNDPHSVERYLRAQARYRAGFDESYQQRARKLFRKPAGSLVTEDEMMRAIKVWDAENKERAKKRAATRAANLAARAKKA